MTNGMELAARHDAAGRHDDALNALAVATRDGDLDAMTELGKRLIVGDRAPYLPRDGAGLLADAARGGNAEASVRLACLTALGAHVEQSWDAAFALLAHAAELGSESARGQLRVLARRTAGAPGENWRELARSVDLTAWLTPLPGRSLHEAPLVRQFSGFVDDSACDWLIERGRGRLRPAMIYSGADVRDVKDQMRTNRLAVLDLAFIDLVNVVVQYRIAAACGMPIANFEGPTVLNYQVGEQITEHTDFVNPTMPTYEKEIATRGDRAITFLVYLNGDYDGGATDFPLLHVRHKGSRGDGLFFVNVLPTQKPDTRAVHAGLPPTRGEKWVLSQFIRTRAVFNSPAENVA
jgi:prolyl 4-hydroxylase